MNTLIFILPLLRILHEIRDKTYQVPIRAFARITYPAPQGYQTISGIMSDYMTLHASAYPPTAWAFLASRDSKPSQTSNNELWTEMTHQYERSMAKRHFDITSNYLSKTATLNNIRRMRPDVQETYRQRGSIAFQDAANVGDLLDNTHRFVKAVDGLAKNPMETIPEEDELHYHRQPTEKESLQINQSRLNAKNYERLLSTEEIKSSFRARLMDIHSACCTFICTPISKHPRPRWGQICRMDREVTAHVAHVAQAQRQSTSDVAKLIDLLRGQLFDEYCLMKETPLEKKDKTWLQYGKCLILGVEICKGGKSLTQETTDNFEPGEREVGDRLDRMIDASRLDPDWVMDHIEDYYAGNDHIGRWQRYMQECRWKELAAKLAMDIQQLEKINSTRKSSNSRRCNIMVNMLNTRGQFFERLHGAQDFELSEKALRMEEEYNLRSASSSSSSSTTVSTV